MASRIVESTIIVVGLISMLALLTMRDDFADTAGADSALYVGLGKSLIALHDWTFILGPAFCAGIGNGIMLGYLLYRGELVPRAWGLFGMAAGTIAFISATLQLLGVVDNPSTAAGSLIIPEFVWEAFIGIYMTFWGFKRTSPVLDREPARVS